MNNYTTYLFFILMSTSLFSMEKTEHVSLVGTTFINQHLRNVDFSNRDLRNVTFSNCDLHGAHFENTNLTGVHFNHCILDNATFTNAIMKNVTCFPPAPEKIALTILAEQAK